MNILIQTIVSPFQHKQNFGGAETSLKLNAKKLSSRGHKVFFVTQTQEKNILVDRKVNTGRYHFILIWKIFFASRKPPFH